MSELVTWVKDLPVFSRSMELADAVEHLWNIRACLVCGELGVCAHREFAVDAAELAKQ